MEKDLVYAVVGCGAIGGFYGAKLANSGKAVNFLLHSDYDYVKLHGLTVESVDGDIILEHPAVYNDATTMPSADVRNMRMLEDHRQSSVAGIAPPHT